MKDNFADICLEAGLKAGSLIMEFYKQGFQVAHKSDYSPVTEADKQADTLIRSYLRETGLPIISEETKPEEFSIRQSWKKVWIVDPLDGTKEFIKKTGEFTVNIALVEEGEPTEGLVFAPASGLLYRTWRGQAWKEIYSADESGEYGKNEGFTLSGLDNKAPDSICASISHANEATNRFIERYRRSNPRAQLISIGSSLKFCLLAEGKAQLYPRFSPTMEWDTAAGQAVLRAAGGNVWDLKSRFPIRYNRENLRNGNFIAASANISQEEAFSYL